MEKLVSVCIPVYNSEMTIRSTIDTALNQTYRNIEVVVVDNCSTDHTFEIVQSYSDPRLKVYRNDKNIGMVANWNKCLEYAQGEYLHFLCGDDLLCSSCIEKKIEIAEQDEKISFVFSASKVVNSKNQIVLERHFGKKTTAIFDGKKIAKKAFLSHNLFGEPSNLLIRKSFLEKVGCFYKNLSYMIDFDMWLRLAIIGKVAYIDD